MTKQEKLDAFARKKGYPSYFAYRNDQAKAEGYLSYADKRAKLKQAKEAAAKANAGGQRAPVPTRVPFKPQNPVLDMTRDLRMAYRQGAKQATDASLTASRIGGVKGGANKSILAKNDLVRPVEGMLNDLDDRVQHFYSKEFPKIYAAGARAADPKWIPSPDDRRVVEDMIKDSGGKLVKNNQVARQNVRKKIPEFVDMPKDEAFKQARRRPIKGVPFQNGAQVGFEQYAEMVIRSSGSTAYNTGYLKTSIKAGVEVFEVFDGPDCGWTSHKDGEKATGKRVSGDDAMSHLIAHPNCQRTFWASSGDPDKGLFDKAKDLAVKVGAGAGGVVAVKATAYGNVYNILEYLAADERVREAVQAAFVAGRADLQQIQHNMQAVTELYDYSLRARVAEMGNVTDIKTKHPLPISHNDIAEDVVAWMEDFAEGLEVPDHVLQIIGAPIGSSRIAVGAQLEKFNTLYNASYKQAGGGMYKMQPGWGVSPGKITMPTKVVGGPGGKGPSKPIFDPNVWLERKASQAFFNWLGPKIPQAKYLRLTFPDVNHAGTFINRPVRLTAKLGDLVKVTRTTIKDRGVINHLSLNPNGLVRLGLTKDPVTGHITPTFRLVPPGPLHILTKVNRGVHGNITSLSTELRLITGKSIPLLNSVTARFNLNLRKLGISTLSDIKNLTLEDFRAFAIEDIRGISAAATLRIRGYNLFDISRTFRLPWEEAQKLWRLSNFAIDDQLASLKAFRARRKMVVVEGGLRHGDRVILPKPDLTIAKPPAFVPEAQLVKVPKSIKTAAARRQYIQSHMTAVEVYRVEQLRRGGDYSTIRHLRNKDGMSWEQIAVNFTTTIPEVQKIYKYGTGGKVETPKIPKIPKGFEGMGWPKPPTTFQQNVKGFWKDKVMPIRENGIMPEFLPIQRPQGPFVPIKVSKPQKPSLAQVALDKEVARVRWNNLPWGARAKEILNRHYGETPLQIGIGIVPEREARAFYAYMGGEYQEINGILRGTWPPPGWTSTVDTVEAVKARVMEHISIIDRYMSPTPETIRVFRRVETEDAFGLDHKGMKKMKSGERFADKGFMSTSVRESWTRDAGDLESLPGQRQAMTEIEVPEGTRAFWMGDSGWEDELILDRGQTIEFIEYDSSRKLYKFRIVGPDEPSKRITDKPPIKPPKPPKPPKKGKPFFDKPIKDKPVDDSTPSNVKFLPVQPLNADKPLSAAVKAEVAKAVQQYKKQKSDLQAAFLKKNIQRNSTKPVEHKVLKFQKPTPGVAPETIPSSPTKEPPSLKKAVQAGVDEFKAAKKTQISTALDDLNYTTLQGAFGDLDETTVGRKELLAIDTYKDEDGYREINGLLRGHLELPDPSLHTEDQIYQLKAIRETLDSIETLDGMMKPIPQDVAVYRWTRSLDAFGNYPGGLKPGARYGQSAYLSTSTHRLPEDHLLTGPDTLMRIEVPEGTRGVWMGGSETELLLERNLALEVVRWDADAKLLHMRVVPVQETRDAVAAFNLGEATARVVTQIERLSTPKFMTATAIKDPLVFTDDFVEFYAEGDTLAKKSKDAYDAWLKAMHADVIDDAAINSLALAKSIAESDYQDWVVAASHLEAKANATLVPKTMTQHQAEGDKLLYELDLAQAELERSFLPEVEASITPEEKMALGQKLTDAAKAWKDWEATPFDPIAKDVKPLSIFTEKDKVRGEGLLNAANKASNELEQAEIRGVTGAALKALEDKAEAAVNEYTMWSAQLFIVPPPGPPAFVRSGDPILDRLSKKSLDAWETFTKATLANTPSQIDAMELLDEFTEAQEALSDYVASQSTKKNSEAWVAIFGDVDLVPKMEQEARELLEIDNFDPRQGPHLRNDLATAVEEYQSDEGYRIINNLLRYPEEYQAELNGANFQDYDQTVEEIERIFKVVDDLDRMMKPIPEDVIVSRLFNSQATFKIADAMDLPVGHRFSDNAFTSTSVPSLDPSGGFFEMSDSQMSILVPKGTKGFLIDGGEQEFLMQRGLTFEIVGKNTDTSTLLVKVVPQERVARAVDNVTRGITVPRVVVEPKGSPRIIPDLRAPDEGPPDYFIGSDGKERWGQYGGAGVLFKTPDGRYLVVKRGEHVHMGGTYSIPGGAIDPGETALEAAMREAREEVGYSGTFNVVDKLIYQPIPEWSYTTYIVEIDADFNSNLDWETESVEWVTRERMGELPLHPGFQSTVDEIFKVKPPLKEDEAVAVLEDLFGINPYIPFTDEASEAYGLYTVSYGYRNINDFLRGKPVVPHPSTGEIINLEDMPGIIQAIDGTMKEIPAKLKVYRNSELDVFDVERIEDLRLGQRMADDGYMSTFVRRSTPSATHPKNRPILLEIETAEGTRGQWLGGFEDELLLERGTTLEVVEWDADANLVRVKVVPKDTPAKPYSTSKEAVLLNPTPPTKPSPALTAAEKKAFKDIAAQINFKPPPPPAITITAAGRPIITRFEAKDLLDQTFGTAPLDDMNGFSKTYNALRHYQVAGYENINDLLRGKLSVGDVKFNAPHFPLVPKTSGPLSEFTVDDLKEVIEDIGLIDGAMQDLPASMVLYREVITETAFPGFLQPSQLLPGHRWGDKAYVSTSVTEHLMKDSPSGYRTNMEILVPKGTKGIWMADWEREVLLQRGLTYEVVRWDDARQRLIVKVVPNVRPEF